MCVPFYCNFDLQGRAQTITYLDGTAETLTYNCCTLGSLTGRDGTVTTYGYDSLKRRISETVGGVSSLTDYDYSGNASQTRRQGTDQSILVLSRIHYNTANEPDIDTNSMGAITTYSDVLVNGIRTRTTTSAVGLPELSTRVETYYLDGQLHETGGTGSMPVRYEFGIEGDSTAPLTDQNRLFQKTIRLDSIGGINEWTKSYTDFVGRIYKTIYADPTTGTLADNPTQLTEFNTLGQVSRSTDPDGVATLLRYNAKGELVVTAVDLDSNGIVADYLGAATGNDRVTQTLTTYLASGAAGNTRGTNIRRTETTVWTANGNTATAKISTIDSSLDGLQTWKVDYKDQTPTEVTSRTQTVYSGAGNRLVTSYRPDGSYTVKAYSNGLPVSVTMRDSSNGQIQQITYIYDAHGRQWKVTDARNGSTIYGYRTGTDLIEAVTTPNPGTGEAAQVTTTLYDNLLRPKSIIQTDGTTITREYFPTGLLKDTYGSRTYPVQYTYDAQGRMQTMTTWQNYAGGQNPATTTWKYEPYRGWLGTNIYQGQSLGTEYTYTQGGRLKTRKWARTGTGGQRIVATYMYGFEDKAHPNQHGDLVSVGYSNDPVNTPSITYTYDRRGRKWTTLFNGMTATYSYNDANQPLAEAYSGGTLNGLTMTWGYDNYLRRNALGANTTTAVSQGYGYDLAGRLSTVTDGVYSATYAYYPNSRLVNAVTSKQNSMTQLTASRSYDLLERLRSITSIPGTTNQVPDYNGYQYNTANQRTRRILADGSYWAYTYDTLGQVTSGKRYWSDGTPVAGQQFEYTFDDIGNRTTTKAGGDQTGANLRSASYTPNLLNQYTSRTVPSAVDVLGLATASSTVTVNGSSSGVYRRGEYFRKEVTVANASTSVFQSLSISAGGTAQTGNLFVPAATENFGSPSNPTTYPGYDLDGNLLRDGRWLYTWDAENRLVKMQPLDYLTAPVNSRRQLDFEYDVIGRRIHKKVTNLDTANVVSETRFVYDGWNILAELTGASGSAAVRSYLWGSDLSGTIQGAGGVGGLLAIRDTSTGVSHFVGYDGNGNVSVIVDGSTGAVSGTYEYGPFGEVIRATGPMAKANPIRFSTKYQDGETDLVYYGYRYYNASTGRWLSRDPIEENGGLNLYGFVRNDSTDGWDLGGLLSATRDVFNITFEPHHSYTKVTIHFHSGHDKCGKRNCESPKLAQIAVDFGGSLGHWLNPFGLPGEWFLDTDGAHRPWYPYQVATGSGVVDMVDAPGSRWWHPGEWFYPFYQFLETCAVCTDDGPGKYRIIGCANWGHHIAGIGASSRWGDGDGLPPVPPSANFIRLFK